jgi:hypothetical protein
MTWYLPLIFGILHWTPLQRMIGPCERGVIPPTPVLLQIPALRTLVVICSVRSEALWTGVPDVHGKALPGQLEKLKFYSMEAIYTRGPDFGMAKFLAVIILIRHMLRQHRLYAKANLRPGFSGQVQLVFCVVEGPEHLIDHGAQARFEAPFDCLQLLWLGRPILDVLDVLDVEPFIKIQKPLMKPSLDAQPQLQAIDLRDEAHELEAQQAGAPPVRSAYERHLRKPQNASFPNQYLQELGGETTASLSSAIYMADSSSSNKEQALVIVVPVGLPPELHQCAPEYFLVVDSGATVHCLWDATCTAHLREQNSSIGWGGVDSRAVCIATGHLCGVTFCKSKSNKWSNFLITSGINDAWVIPTAARMLFSQVRAKQQGHRCVLDGPNPGLIICDTNDFVPFVIEEETQFCMFPMHPPPTSSARHAGLYSSSMRVLNLEGSGKSSSKAHALIFNPLVSKILLKRSALKRASHADIKQRKLLQVESRRIQKEKQRLLEEKRHLVEEKRLIRDQANRTNYHSYHRRCGHANMKNLITFKRHGKVTASRLPPKFLRNYRKDCPICVAMKKRRKSLPKGPNSAHELDHLVPWEEVFTDSSGKFRRKSKEGNN